MISDAGAPADVALTSVAPGKRASIAARNFARNARNWGVWAAGIGSKSKFAPSAARRSMRFRAWPMNRFWAVALPRNAVIFGSDPESNSWNVGTTRTPFAWAAFVTAVASALR